MTTMKRLGICALLAALVLSFPAASFAREFVMGQKGQPLVTFAQAGEKFAELLDKHSGGKMKVQVMGAAALGNNREGIEQIQQGVTDFWLISTGLLAPFTKAVTVYDIPYLFKSEKAALDFVNSDLAMEVVKPLEEKGIKPLGYFIMGWRHTHSNIAIRTPEDLKGVKIRTEPAPIRMAIFKAMGANPIPMDFGEVFTSLQQGIIDGQENPYDLIKSASFFEVQKFVNMTEHVRGWIYLVIGEDRFQSMPKDIQAAVLEAGKVAQAYERQLFRAEQDQLVQDLKDKGMTFVEVDKAAFMKVAEPAVLKFLSPELQEMYKKIVAIQ